ncbi:hypothetical protein [Siphonobacter sp. BAB-5405]|nr:hypothetical protein [Siphonobacter sp. BAB-5405]
MNQLQPLVYNHLVEYQLQPLVLQTIWLNPLGTVLDKLLDY